MQLSLVTQATGRCNTVVSAGMTRVWEADRKICRYQDSFSVVYLREIHAVKFCACIFLRLISKQVFVFLSFDFTYAEEQDNFL